MANESGPFFFVAMLIRAAYVALILALAAIDIESVNRGEVSRSANNGQIPDAFNRGRRAEPVTPAIAELYKTLCFQFAPTPIVTRPNSQRFAAFVEDDRPWFWIGAFSPWQPCLLMGAN